MGFDIYPAANLSWRLSLLVVVGTSLLTLGFAVAGFLRARRRGQLAAEATSRLDPARATQLHEGDAVLSGVVVHADDHDVAVRIDVTQHGTEAESSGSWSYSWTEVDRAIIVKPFYLELIDKTRVRVLAPPTVEVADALDHKVLIGHDRRVLSAELIPGEALHAQGRLERGAMRMPGAETGYRDASYEWQLVPSHGRMLLSSEPLGQGLLERAAFHRRHAWWLALWFIILQAGFSHYYTRAFEATQPGTVVAQHVASYEDSDGDPQTDYIITLELPDRSSRQFEIDGADYRRIRAGTELGVRRGVLGWELGARPTLHFLTSIIALVISIGLVRIYVSRRHKSRPWFRRTVTHSGSGRLPGD